MLLNADAKRAAAVAAGQKKANLMLLNADAKKTRRLRSFALGLDVLMYPGA